MFRALVLGSFLAAPILAQQAANAPASQPSTEAERLVIMEMSRARLHPKEYARGLKPLVKHFEGTLWRLPEHIPIRTEEGAAALEELITFLERSPSTGPLRWSEGLGRAARTLVLEQGPTGRTGHIGPTGSTLQARSLRHGLYQSMVGEVISYGVQEARWIVLQLLIDDGVASRAHRKAIFNPGFHVAGAAIGPHAEYGEMAVVDLADGFLENPASK